MGTPTVVPLWFGGVTGISNAVDISTAKAVVGLVMPPAWTPAVITVEGSADGTNFYTMYEGRSVEPDQFQRATRHVCGGQSEHTALLQGDPADFG